MKGSKPAAKPVAAFARHTFADSSAQIPCAITERKGPTVVVIARDCVRFYLLWLTILLVHVPPTGFC